LFDITSETGPVLSFGQGKRLCIGAPLVRAEVAIGLGSLLVKLRNLECRESPLRWIPRIGHRWLESLRVTFDPGRDN